MSFNELCERYQLTEEERLMAFAYLGMIRLLNWRGGDSLKGRAE